MCLRFLSRAIYRVCACCLSLSFARARMQMFLRETRSSLSNQAAMFFGPPHMGDPTDVIHGLVSIPSGELWPSSWPTDEGQRQQTVLRAQHLLGLNYKFQSRCDVHREWQHVDDTFFSTHASQFIWSLPRRRSRHGLQNAIDRAAGTRSQSSAEDVPSVGRCPQCISEGVVNNSCEWRRCVPPTFGSAPSNLMFHVQPAQDLHTFAPTIATTIRYGAIYDMVAIVYTRPGHFVSQILLDGQHWSYDCLHRGGQAQQTLVFSPDNLRGQPYLMAFKKRKLPLPSVPVRLGYRCGALSPLEPLSPGRSMSSTCIVCVQR